MYFMSKAGDVAYTSVKRPKAGEGSVLTIHIFSTPNFSIDFEM